MMGWAVRILPLLYAAIILVASAGDAPWSGFVLVMILILIGPALLAWLMATRFFPDRPGFVLTCQLIVFVPPFLIGLGALRHVDPQPAHIFLLLLVLFPLFQIIVLIVAIVVGRAVIAGRAESAKSGRVP